MNEGCEAPHGAPLPLVFMSGRPEPLARVIGEAFLCPGEASDRHWGRGVQRMKNDVREKVRTTTMTSVKRCGRRMLPKEAFLFPPSMSTGGSKMAKSVLVGTALIVVLLSQKTGWGQDKLMFNSGRIVSCEILDYANEMFTVRMEDGTLNRAPARNIKRIHFATLPSPNRTEGKQSEPESILDNSAAPAQDGEFTFRETRWGMSKEEVIALEGPPGLDTEDTLSYETTVNGMKAGIVYTFVEGLLAQGGYVFTEVHYEKNDYIADYHKIENLLKAKYGKPTQDGHLWYKKLFKDKEEDWGLALSLGHHCYLSIWKAGNTAIIHSLQGKDREIGHLIQYQEISLYERKEANSKKSALESL